MLLRTKSEVPLRERAASPGLIAMAVAAVLTAMFLPTSYRIHDEACRMVSAASQLGPGQNLIASTDDAGAVSGCVARAERE